MAERPKADGDEQFRNVVQYHGIQRAWALLEYGMDCGLPSLFRDHTIRGRLKLDEKPHREEMLNEAGDKIAESN